MAAYEFVTETGVIVPDTEDLKTEVQDEYKDVFGDELDLDDETPEGVLISAETAARTGVAQNNAALANQINPNINGGIFLDAVWALTGGARQAASRSTFTSPPLLTGVAGTLIPAGSQAQTAAGDLFESVGDVTLDGSGNGSVNFQSVETGAIVALSGTLTTIVSNVLGWETITNPVDATLGVAQQSDVSSRFERKNTLAFQGSALALAVYSAVQAVENVKSLTFRENKEAAPAVIDNVNLVANSVWACVDGGTDADVAAALLRAKGGGCNWNNGNSANPVTENVVEPTSGQSYVVEFDRPDDVPVLYRVTISQTPINNPQGIITQALLDYANGELDGYDGLVVGADVSPFEASAAINSVEPGINILNVEVTKADVINYQPATIDIELFEQASIDAGSITVVIV